MFRKVKNQRLLAAYLKTPHISLFHFIFLLLTWQLKHKKPTTQTTRETERTKFSCHELIEFICVTWPEIRHDDDLCLLKKKTHTDDDDGDSVTLLYAPQKKYRDFRLQGVLDSTLNSKMYDTVRNRLTVEEATASVREGGMQGISMKDSDEEDEEDD